MAGLVSIGGSGQAQIWVEYPGCGQLTTGTKTGVVALWCNSAGSVSITFATGETETRAYDDGNMVAFPFRTASVTITSGTFSFMVA